MDEERDGKTENLTNFIVEDESSRLDMFVSNSVEDLSRAQAKRLIDSGMIKVNGAASKSSAKLKPGDRVTIEIPQPEPLEVTPENIELDVVFEDEHLIVVNKKAGMVTHPGAGVNSGTLVNALLHHCRGQLAGIGGVERPGIVHRLDKDTAGLMIVAKNDRAHKILSEMIADRKVKRVYTALLQGVMKDGSGTIDKPIGRHPIHRKQMAIVMSGRNAVTHYEVLKRLSSNTVIEARLETGRTHQIRVHMSSLGFPVVGDLIYNKKGTGTENFRRRHELNGHCLYATKLTFRHPLSGELLEFEIAPPVEFDKVVASLER